MQAKDINLLLLHLEVPGVPGHSYWELQHLEHIDCSFLPKGIDCYPTIPSKNDSKYVNKIDKGLTKITSRFTVKNIHDRLFRFQLQEMFHSAHWRDKHQAAKTCIRVVQQAVQQPGLRPVGSAKSQSGTGSPSFRMLEIKRIHCKQRSKINATSIENVYSPRFDIGPPSNELISSTVDKINILTISWKENFLKTQIT